MPVFEVFEDEADLDEIYIRLKDQDAMVRRIAVLDLAENLRFLVFAGRQWFLLRVGFLFFQVLPIVHCLW